LEKARATVLGSSSAVQPLPPKPATPPEEEPSKPEPGSDPRCEVLSAARKEQEALLAAKEEEKKKELQREARKAQDDFHPDDLALKKMMEISHRDGGLDPQTRVALERSQRELSVTDSVIEMSRRHVCDGENGELLARALELSEWEHSSEITQTTALEDARALQRAIEASKADPHANPRDRSARIDQDSQELERALRLSAQEHSERGVGYGRSGEEDAERQLQQALELSKLEAAHEAMHKGKGAPGGKGSEEEDEALMRALEISRREALWKAGEEDFEDDPTRPSPFSSPEGRHLARQMSEGKDHNTAASSCGSPTAPLFISNSIGWGGAGSSSSSSVLASPIAPSP